MPAYFCRGAPIALRDPELPPLLVLPIPLGLAAAPARGATLAPDGARRGQSLVALLGRTRAAVLGAVVAGCTTTTGLAGRVGVSLASASQHATVLRNAGLITTRRIDCAVEHTPTALGVALLHREA